MPDMEAKDLPHSFTISAQNLEQQPTTEKGEKGEKEKSIFASASRPRYRGLEH